MALKNVMVALATCCMPTLGTAGTAGNSAPKPVDFGKMEYEAKCASCHGVSGKGDGPTAGYLTQKAADLTVIAKGNNGILPVERMYQVITGEIGMPVHGSREMPVWGTTYRIQAAEQNIDTPYDPEKYVRARVLTLIEYISRLQVK